MLYHLCIILRSWKSELYQGMFFKFPVSYPRGYIDDETDHFDNHLGGKHKEPLL